MVDKLDALMSNQHNVNVKWKDNDGKEHSKDITMKVPSFRTINRAKDLLNVGSSYTDWGSLLDLIMKDVIVQPSLSFDILSAKVPAKLKEHVVTDKNDGKNKLTLRFPTRNGFRLSITTALMMTSAYDGKLNNEGYSDSIAANFIVDPKDKEKIGVDEDYFDTNPEFGNQVMQEAAEWLSEIISFGGASPILMNGYSFLYKKF